MLSYDHELYQLLCSVGAIDPEHIELYATQVRDRNDIPVMRCKKSGVIFLGSLDHVKETHYVEKDVQHYYGTSDIPTPLVDIKSDKEEYFELDNDKRKQEAFGHLIENKSWLDFGCATGTFIELMGAKCKDAWGIELNGAHRKAASLRGLKMVEKVSDISNQKFDIITLFHVFEHLPDPISIINDLKSILSEDGIILIEVPHANDFLLDTLDSEEFKKFTLWSEHLILHTRDSLATVLKAAGLSQVEVSGHQRFPLSNHLYWLRHGAPGGHEKWDFLNSPELKLAYDKILIKNNQTDTIVAIARP